MAPTPGSPKPKFVVDENGKKTGVMLSLEQYETLIDAWEEVADAEDFAEARKTATDSVSPAELRRCVHKDE